MTTYCETIIDYDSSKSDKVGRELKSKITYDGIIYNTSLFYTPIQKDSREYKYLVSKVSSRKQYDKAQNKFVTCLDITASDVKNSLDITIVSLYLFVNENRKALTDQASGTLQVVNNNIDATVPSQAWICDLCRHAPDKTKKSSKSPVAPIMHLFEQIAYYVFKKRDIYLMVSKIPDSSDEPYLVSYYRDNYGFSVDDDFRVNDETHIVMKKHIIPDSELADFPFDELPVRKYSTKKISYGTGGNKYYTRRRRSRQ